MPEGDTEARGVKLDSLYLQGKHLCDTLLHSDPLIITIDEKDRLIVVTSTVIHGSLLIWFKIEYCPFCGAKL